MMVVGGLDRGLRAIQLLALVVWVGGLLFFAFALAPVAFHVLPNAREAGLVVGGSLRVLHWMGLGSGVLYLTACLFLFRQGRRVWALPALIAAMLVLTAVSQWAILPRMERDRTAAHGAISDVAREDPARTDFDRLHKLSEQVEGGVLLLGLITVVITGAARDRRVVGLNATATTDTYSA